MISDVICPWCFLGKRRLDKALALVPEVKVEVNYRPFFLDPSIPAQGLSREDYMRGKFGDRDLAAMHKPLADAGKKDGVPYHFEKVTRTPNTLDAHRLIRWAKQFVPNKRAEMKEALLCAYWRDGRDVGDHKVLAEVEHAYQLGVSGVPTFIFNNKYGVSGAQEAESLAQMMRDVAEKS